MLFFVSGVFYFIVYKGYNVTVRYVYTLLAHS